MEILATKAHWLTKTKRIDKLVLTVLVRIRRLRRVDEAAFVRDSGRGRAATAGGARRVLRVAAVIRILSMTIAANPAARAASRVRDPDRVDVPVVPGHARHAEVQRLRRVGLVLGMRRQIGRRMQQHRHAGRFLIRRRLVVVVVVAATGDPVVAATFARVVLQLLLARLVLLVRVDPAVVQRGHWW